MWRQLFRLSSDSDISLQRQLRKALAAAILDGRIPPDRPLPSSRELARQLGIARNTVVLSYQHLVESGYVLARARSGYFVNPEMLQGRHQACQNHAVPASIDWQSRLKSYPSRQRNIQKPTDWWRYKYPFIYGQPDPELFPTADWRDCCRELQSVAEVNSAAKDRFDADDPLLVEQIQNRVLPRRGVWADKDEILITLGAQHALYLLAELFLDRSSRVGVEDPGYPDVRNIFSLRGSEIVPLPVDREGVIPGRQMDSCDVVYVTPSHHVPSTVTLPEQRRHELLDRAAREDFLLLEDDYESETNFIGESTPALKSLDHEDRVIYVGGLSKTLAPGLRVGFMVGPKALIREARALRRLMVRHPPSNNQRIVALFLSMGYHDSHTLRLNKVLRERWHLMSEALSRHLPNSFHTPTFGGTSYWVKGDPALDSEMLAVQARKHGLLLEPGGVYFADEHGPRNFFRLGYSSIKTVRIEPGVELLAALIRQQLDSSIGRRTAGNV
jgi:GntR family transcriptional regulator/MocR family aminotransferase